MHITLITWVRFLSYVGSNMHYQNFSFCWNFYYNDFMEKGFSPVWVFMCYKVTSFKFYYYTEYINRVNKVLSRVSFHMFDQRITDTHITLITWVRFISYVGYNMHYQLTSFIETLLHWFHGYGFSPVWVFLCVTRLLPSRSLTTLNTLIRFLSRVGFHMFDQRITLTEPLISLATWIGFLSFVGSYM